MSKYEITQRILSDLYEEGEIAEILFADPLSLARYRYESKPLQKTDEQVFNDAIAMVELLIREGDFSMRLCRTGEDGQFFITQPDDGFLQKITKDYKADESEREYEFGLFLIKEKRGCPAPKFFIAELARLGLE